jgi:uncharacterized protein
MTTDPRTVVTRYVEAVRDGDVDVVRASFAPDATWHYPGDLPISRTWTGRDAIVDEFLGGVGALLEPGAAVVIELTNVLAEGDQVVAEWTSRATAKGGAAYLNHCVGIFTVKDGQISDVREYLDTQHVATTLFG